MSAVKTAGLGDNFYVDGYDLSGDTQQLGSVHGGPAALDQTDITKSAYVRVGTLFNGGIDWVSYFDKQTNQAHAALGTLPRTNRIVTYCRGTLQGSQAASLQAKQINYDPTRGTDASLVVAISAQNDSFPLEWGTLLTAGIRTDTTATSPVTGLDGLASSAVAAQFYLHVFNVTGTSVTVTIQDSADNSSFSNITGGAFSAATGKTSQRIALAAGTTVRRYVRAITTGTFTNAQFAVNMIRNEVAVTY